MVDGRRINTAKKEVSTLALTLLDVCIKNLNHLPTQLLGAGAFFHSRQKSSDKVGGSSWTTFPPASGIGTAKRRCIIATSLLNLPLSGVGEVTVSGSGAEPPLAC